MIHQLQCIRIVEFLEVAFKIFLEFRSGIMRFYIYMYILSVFILQGGGGGVWGIDSLICQLAPLLSNWHHC